MAIESYLGGYLDRRMKDHIAEWQLATRRDVADIGDRISVLEQEVARISASTGSASGRLADLEARARRLKEAHRK